jgi:hypothetical protein
LEPPGETKVADLELAVGVDEQVPRLEIAVEDVGRVDVLSEASGGQACRRAGAQADRGPGDQADR